MRNKKKRRKKWFYKRIKAQRKQRFNKAFRDHFVRKGILKGDEPVGS